MLGGLFIALFILTFGVVFFGAPYVPTRQKDVEKLFDLVDLSDGHLVDLGAGDGRLMLAAAKRQLNSTGWELSPVIWAIAWCRLRSHRSYADIRLGSFWRAKLPDDTKAAFTFLASRHMKQLDGFLSREAKRLGHPIHLVSYGFQVPGRTIEKQDGALIVYRFEP